jgi:hypothetical protein
MLTTKRAVASLDFKSKRTVLIIVSARMSLRLPPSRERRRLGFPVFSAPPWLCGNIPFVMAETTIKAIGAEIALHEIRQHQESLTMPAEAARRSIASRHSAAECRR